MKIRIKDIAARANVSPGTVDRVIHNRGEVSAATRKKILAIVKELNYEPDILASTLASKKKIHIATLIPACSDDDSIFWLGPQSGIENALAEIEHFNIKVSHFQFNLYAKESFSVQAQHLLSSNPDGVVLAPIFAREAMPLIDEMAARRIPFVFINSNIPLCEACLSFIGQDSYQSGYLAAKLMHFGLLGKHKIIILNILRENSVQQHILQRENGFREYFRAHPAIELTTITVKGMGQDKVDHELNQILTTRNGYSGLFVTNSKVHKAANFLNSKGMSSIRLIGYDLVEPSRSYLQKGTIDFLINQRPDEQGYRGVMAIFQHLVLRKQLEREQYMPMDIITRENLLYYR